MTLISFYLPIVMTCLVLQEQIRLYEVGFFLSFHHHAVLVYDAMLANMLDADRSINLAQTKRMWALENTYGLSHEYFPFWLVWLHVVLILPHDCQSYFNSLTIVKSLTIVHSGCFLVVLHLISKPRQVKQSFEVEYIVSSLFWSLFTITRNPVMIS